MKASILLFCAATAQGAVLWWPGQHHAPGQPCGHHQMQHHQPGAIHEHVNQAGPFSFRIPIFRHIRIFWHSASTRPILPSPAEIMNQVFDNENHDVEEVPVNNDDTPPPPPATETVQPEEKNNEITILPYTGHLDGEVEKAKAEEVKKEDVVDGEDEEAHEDLRRIKQKRQFPGTVN